MFLNACSIRNKSCLIRDAIIDNSVDLFFVVETWLTSSDTSSIAAFLPDTHDFYHFPRDNRRGGGVGVAVSKSIASVKTIPRVFESFECLEINFIYKNKKKIRFL